MKIEADPSYQPEPPAGPWDTTFNRAMNEYKGRGKRDAPTSAGHVTGFGTVMKFTEYYSTDTEKKKERRRPSKDRAEVLELRKKLDALEAEKVDDKLRALLPDALVQGITAWHAGGQQGPIHVPSFAGSTSSNNVSPILPTPPVPPAVEQHTPTPENNDNAHERPEIDRPAAGTGALVSTLAELNAVTKVTN